MLNNLIYPEKVCFVHIPKCGGTFIGTLLKKQYFIKRLIKTSKSVNVNAKDSSDTALFFSEEAQYFRNKLVYYFLKKGKLDFCEGHIALHRDVLAHFVSSWNFVALLRDPVSRFFSQYFYARNKISNHAKTYLDLDDWLSSKRGIESARMYVNYFSYELDINSYSLHEKILRAKENLANYYTIGFTEDIKQFLSNNNINFFSYLSYYKTYFTKSNKNPVRNYMSNVSIEQKKKVEEMCQPDIEIYKWARAKFLI